MIITMLALSLASCPQTKITNTSHESWRVDDQSALDSVKNRCKELYGGEAPCLKEFIKYEHNAYNVVCGKASDE